MPPIAELYSTEVTETQAGWLPAGTLIYTAEGVLPVDYLSAGDRVVTRSGMRPLRAFRSRQTAAGPLFSLHFDEAETIYADGHQVRTPALKAA